MLTSNNKQSWLYGTPVAFTDELTLQRLFFFFQNHTERWIFDGGGIYIEPFKKNCNC